jgi:hypothetical protein
MAFYGFVLAALLVTAGCSSTQYAYRPTDVVNAEIEGRPASRYDVPPEAPRGSLAVTTFGIVDVPPQAGADEVPMIGVRMVASNDNDTGVWRIDTRRQVLEIPGAGKSQAAFVTADAQGSPELEVPPNQKRTIDFYYPLPEGREDPEDIPACDFTWEVQTPTRPVAGRTPFERVTVEPAYYPYHPRPYGWGPYFWYDPLWGSMAFVHPVYVGPWVRPYWVGPRYYPHYRPYGVYRGGYGYHYGYGHPGSEHPRSYAPGRSYAPSHPHRR